MANFLTDATFAGNLTLNGADGHINLDGNNAAIFDNSNNNNAYYIRNGGSNAATLQMGTGSPGSNIKLTLDGSGNATFAGDLYIPSKVIHAGDEDTWMQFETNVISLRTGGADRLTLTNSLATISEPLLIDGVLNYTGLEVKGTGASRPSVNLSNATTGILGQVYATESSALVFATTTSGTTALTLDSSQNATFAGNLTFPTGYLSDYIYHTGDTNTYFGFNANDQFRVNCAGNTKFNVTSTQINTYSAEITTSGSPQYFTYGGSGSHALVFRENGPGGYKNSIIANAGGGVQLYYNNSEKLVTQSGGVSLGNNSLYLGQYSAINLNGVGPSAGKVITGTGSSAQLTWNDSVSNITVGTGLDISSSTSNGAITKNLTLDFNELPVIDGDDPQADWFIVESSEDENSKINRSDLQSVDAHWKTTQTILTSNFDDRSSSTSIYYMPLNYISEVTSANYYNTFACPRGGTVKRIMMMHTAGSTMSTSFTTELSILKNGLSTSFSGELTPSNGSNDGSNITWSPNYTFTAGDRLNFRYQKSATGKYWYGVSVSIVVEFDNI